MAEPLKHALGAEAVRWLSESLARAAPGFDIGGFADACLDGLDGLELKARAAHIARCMARFLPGEFPKAAAIVANSLGPEVSATGENGLSVLRYLAHDSFIELFGLEHPEEAFGLQQEVTKRSSCEFSIRALYLKHPELTYRQVLQWACADNAHLRRLASEGSRPRLPWAQRLPAFQRDPAPVIAVLELLKDDPERYVQRSVANNINDISKDWPDRAVALCREWLKDAPEGRQWVVRHALRDLVKKGHKGALELIGAGRDAEVIVENVQVSPKQVKRGGTLVFQCDLLSTSSAGQDLLVDYVIGYVKANGTTSPKVFKLKRLSLAPHGRAEVTASMIFKDLTTRKHHPGRHGLALQINGRRFEIAEFELLA
jgi:3-methyladenine DNA glycosylase AlkC